VYDLRKMGHVTLVGEETESRDDLLATVRGLVDGLSFD